jgi:predicted TIM-barrel fold metal-dependent hydrolase
MNSDLYDDLPIVDAHHHLWDLEGGLTYPWMTSGEHAYQGDNSAFRRTYLPPEYRRDTALHNVIATVHVEAECDRSRQVEETKWLTGIAAIHGMPNAIVAHAWVDTPESEEIIVRQKAFPLVRGIRTKPIISRGRPTACGASRAACRIRSGGRASPCSEARPVVGPACRGGIWPKPPGSPAVPRLRIALNHTDIR